MTESGVLKHALMLAISVPALAQTVEAQLQSLRAEALAVAGVLVTELPDLTMIEDRPNLSITYFTKPGHYAHPAAVVRMVVQEGGAWFVRYITWPYDMNASPPASFVRWMAEFAALDRAMQADLLRNGR